MRGNGARERKKGIRNGDIKRTRKKKKGIICEGKD